MQLGRPGRARPRPGQSTSARSSLAPRTQCAPARHRDRIVMHSLGDEFSATDPGTQWAPRCTQDHSPAPSQHRCSNVSSATGSRPTATASHDHQVLTVHDEDDPPRPGISSRPHSPFARDSQHAYPLTSTHRPGRTESSTTGPTITTCTKRRPAALRDTRHRLAPHHFPPQSNSALRTLSTPAMSRRLRGHPVPRKYMNVR